MIWTASVPLPVFADMTSKQDVEFDVFGCASRSLLALANAKGAGITKAQFIDRFTPKYWLQGDQCGGLTLEQIKEVAKELGLASVIQESVDFSVVRARIRNRSICSLLVYTRKKYESDGSLSEYHHCIPVSPTALQGDNFLYLTEVDYISGHCRGQFLPQSAIAPLIPTFLLFYS